MNTADCRKVEKIEQFKEKRDLFFAKMCKSCLKKSNA
ncbi:hypothetical protein T11_6549 [Trichinella zimbabwensis]|uniref:Uncharacterized protein n=1 Tax=Trichinella zimbabwensis TaxID=268475 RepID=A0A0V1GL37_9BILA|nr:hypothetical protein T11_6549 [Trichinella zimbabwensis]